MCSHFVCHSFDSPAGLLKKIVGRFSSNFGKDIPWKKEQSRRFWFDLDLDLGVCLLMPPYSAGGCFVEVCTLWLLSGVHSRVLALREPA